MPYHCMVVGEEVEVEHHHLYESDDGLADYRGSRDSLADCLRQAPISVSRSRSFQNDTWDPLRGVKHQTGRRQGRGLRCWPIGGGGGREGE